MALDGEIHLAVADVRGQDGDAQATALGQHHGHTVGRARLDGEACRRVFDRILRFEIGRLARQLGVCCGVRFIESVTCKYLN